MDSDITIYQVMPEDDEFKVKRELHPNIPDVYKAAAILLISPLRGGKTSAIVNFLAREAFYKDLFENVDIISPTVAQDSTWRHLYEEYKNACHLEYHDSVVQGIMDRQTNLMENKQDCGYAVVADDILRMIPATRSRKGNLLTYWLTRFRHFVNKPNPALFILASQKFREVNPTLRANMTDVLINSNIRNMKEIEALKEEYGALCGGESNFLKMFQYVAKEKYQWLYLQLTTGKVFKNFTELLWDGDKLVMGSVDGLPSLEESEDEGTDLDEK